MSSTSTNPRFVSETSTVSRWPGTIGPGTDAMAWKSMPSAVSIAS
jgi:hypothetical protein